MVITIQENSKTQFNQLDKVLSTIKNRKNENDLLFDFTVDKAAKTVFITREFDAELSWCGMLLQNKKFLTNGQHLHRGQKNKIHEF